jgi:hypothetical protein
MKEKMGRSCSTNGRDEKCIQNFSQKKLKESDHLRELATDAKIILKWILTKYGEGMNWIQVALDIFNDSLL